MPGPARLLRLGLLLLFAPAALTSDAWSIQTVLLEPAKVGDLQITVRDCRHVEVGGRLRLSFGEQEEEEAGVASVECPAPGSGAPKIVDAVPPANLPESMCNLASPLAALSPKCRMIAKAALHVPGLASSYRSARKSSEIMSQQPDGGVMPNEGGAALQPTDR